MEPEEVAQFNTQTLLDARIEQLKISPQTPRYQATQEQAWEQVGGTLVFNGELEDGRGNTVTCWSTIDDHVGFAYLELKEANTGRLLEDAIVTPAAGMKCDTAFIWLRQDARGPFVRLRFGNHMPGPGQPEGLSRDVFDWRPAALVAIPFGQSIMGRPGEYPVAETSGDCASTADVQAVGQSLGTAIAALNTSVPSQIRQEFGGNIRSGLQGKNEDAELHMMDPNNHDGKALSFRFLLANFVRDRAYEGCMAALRSAGLIKSSATIAAQKPYESYAPVEVPDEQALREALALARLSLEESETHVDA